MILPTMQYCTLDGIVYVCVCWGEGGYSENGSFGAYSENRSFGGILKTEVCGGGILNFRIGVFCRIWTKFSTTPAGSWITDSLSHTTYVETNKPSTIDFLLYKFHFCNTPRSLITC